VAPANLRIHDKSLRYGRKHLPDDFTVLLPERGGTAPSIYYFFVGLHQQKYSNSAFRSYAL
jgi:hypothetical protein